MTTEERQERIAEIEARAEQFAGTSGCIGLGAKLIEDLAWLIEQVALIDTVQN